MRGRKAFIITCRTGDMRSKFVGQVVWKTGELAISLDEGTKDMDEILKEHGNKVLSFSEKSREKKNQ